MGKLQPYDERMILLWKMLYKLNSFDKWLYYNNNELYVFTENSIAD